MSVITLDPLRALYIDNFTWGQQRNDIQSTSMFGTQTEEIGAPWWKMSFSLEIMNERNSGYWKALVLRLRGQQNQFECWDIGRPIPKGNFRGNMAFAANCVMGQDTFGIDGETSQVGTKFEVGDLIGFGSGLTQQVVMVIEAVDTVNTSGDCTVRVEPPLRNAMTAGTPIRWDRPKALFRCTSTFSEWKYSTLNVEGFGLEFIEDPRP